MAPTPRSHHRTIADHQAQNQSIAFRAIPVRTWPQQRSYCAQRFSWKYGQIFPWLDLWAGSTDTVYQRHNSARVILLRLLGSLETANESQCGRNRSISCHGALRGLRFHFPPNGLKPPASSRSASAAHARLHHRFHVEWVTKYREKVLQGPMRERIGEII